MNLGTKLNNYLNIRYAKQNDWLGQMGQEDGFVKVVTPIDDTPASRAGGALPL